jgi:hypothetical protein
MSRFVAVVSLLSCMGVASAQQQPAARPQAARPVAAAPAPKLTPEQQAAVAKQDAEISSAALRIAQMVDQGKTGEVYDMASATAKKVVTRQDFINGITADRAKVGAPTGRSKPVVTRTRSEGTAQIPAGLYLNVSFPTKFAKLAQPVRELVSFRLDEDKVWRLTGYSLR